MTLMTRWRSCGTCAARFPETRLPTHQVRACFPLVYATMGVDDPSGAGLVSVPIASPARERGNMSVNNTDAGTQAEVEAAFRAGTAAVMAERDQLAAHPGVGVDRPSEDPEFRRLAGGERS
jgi:hypothetical protein